MPLTQIAKRNQRNVLLALSVITLSACWLYGLTVLLQSVCSALLALFLDSVCYRLRGLRRDSGDLSAAISGVMIALMMPAGVSFLLLIIADFIAICVAKHPFGGYGKNVFNPAAVAFSVVLVFFTNQLTTYPAPLTSSDALGSFSIFTESAVGSLADGVYPTTDIWNMLFGQFAGPVAQSSPLILLGCFLFLFITGTIDWRTPVFATFSFAVVTMLFPRVEMPVYLSAVYELSCGLPLFGFIFMASDPVALPTTSTGRAFSGFLLGIAVFLFRSFGHFALGFSFAILVINALTPVMDKSAAYLKELYSNARRSTRNLIRKPKKYATVSPDTADENAVFAADEDAILAEDTKKEISLLLHRLSPNENNASHPSEEGDTK